MVLLNNNFRRLNFPCYCQMLEYRKNFNEHIEPKEIIIFFSYPNPIIIATEIRKIHRFVKNQSFEETILLIIISSLNILI